MIIKNFEINKIDLKLNNLILLYGSNEGFKNEVLNIILKKHNDIFKYEEKTQANWSIKSVYEDFEPYEWFKPQSYISDIVDTNSIKENIQDFYQKNFYSIEDN